MHCDEVKSGVQICAGGIRQAVGCTSSRRIPLTSVPSSAACQLGFYKSAPGDQLCAKCPLHSHSESQAARVCRCDSSFYRAVQDPPSAACTREYPGCPGIRLRCSGAGVMSSDTADVPGLSPSCTLASCMLPKAL